MDSITAKIAEMVIEEKAFTPLLAFMHEALVSIEAEYFEKIVVRFLENGEDVANGSYVYRGATTITNERGERRASLREFDYQFLLHLFEFLTRYDVKSRYPVMWAPRFTEVYPFTRNIQNSVKSLKAQRNMLAHATGHGLGRSHVRVLVGHMLSVFQHEIAIVVEKRPDVFSQETKDAVSDFVRFLETDAIDSIVEAIKRHETNVHEPGVRVDSRPLESHVAEPVAVERSSPPHSSRVWLLQVGIGFVALLLWWFWPTKPVQQPARHTRHYVVAVGRPSTQEQATKLLRYLTDQVTADQPVDVTLLTVSGERHRLLLHADVAQSIQDSAMNVLLGARRVDRPEDFILLYGRAASEAVTRKPVPDSSTVNGTVYLDYLGALPTKEAWLELQNAPNDRPKPTFEKGLIDRIIKRHIRPRFLNYDVVREVDSALIKAMFRNGPQLSYTLLTIQ